MSYINIRPPNYFPTGSLIDPNDVNENFLYVEKALDDVTSHRFEHSIVPLNFQSGAKGSDHKEMRSVRFQAYHSMLLERAYLYFNGTGSVQVNVFRSNIPMGTDIEISGVTNPILKATSTDFAEEETDLYTTQLMLNSGSQYRFELSGTIPNQWMSHKAQLVLHVRSDKLFTGSAEHRVEPSLSLFTETDRISASTFLANSASLANALQINVLGSQTAVKPIFFDYRTPGIFSNSETLKFNIPSGVTGSVRESTAAVSIFTVATGSQQATDSYSIALKDSNGVTRTTFSPAINIGNTGSYEERVTFFNIMNTGSMTSTDPTKDWRLEISGLAYNYWRIYGFIWIG